MKKTTIHIIVLATLFVAFNQYELKAEELTETHEIETTKEEQVMIVAKKPTSAETEVSDPFFDSVYDEYDDEDDNEDTN